MDESGKQENILGRIREILGDEHSFSILQEVVDIDLQMRYFEMSKRYRRVLSLEEVEEAHTLLFSTNPDENDLRLALVCLAATPEVSAFRVLEEYVNSVDQNHRGWAVLAYGECRVNLESQLLDQSQVFISTGLGGHEDRLRYFTVMLSKSGNFTSLQEEVITKELHFYLERSNSIVEDLQFNGKSVSITSLIPLDVALQPLFNDVIHSCNSLGQFLSDDMIITNVRRLTVDDIDDILLKGGFSSNV
jgi:hypothetical protein